MVKGLYTAYTGMINEQNRMDTLTNNLANVSTTGYKKEGATSQSFADVYAYKIKDSSEANLARRLGAISLGVKIGENYTDYTEGAFKVTDNTFDLAIQGNGFFAIQYQNKAGEVSTKYTRDGSFTMDIDGNLRTKDGDYVLGTDGNHITLNPRQDVSISYNGMIYQEGNQAGQIQLTDFADYNYLEKFGENLYQTVEGAEMIPATGQIKQGMLEASNVEAVSEMVQMIAVQRAYDANQKVITTIDDTLDKAVNQLARV